MIGWVLRGVWDWLGYFHRARNLKGLASYMICSSGNFWWENLNNRRYSEVIKGRCPIRAGCDWQVIAF